MTINNSMVFERSFTMSKQQLIENLLATAPENKLDIILAFIQFVLYNNCEANSSFLSEPSLSKDWLREEEETAWRDL